MIFVAGGKGKTAGSLPISESAAVRYEKERSEAIERGMDPEELPEAPKTMLDVLYYLERVKNQEADK